MTNPIYEPTTPAKGINRPFRSKEPMVPLRAPQTSRPYEPTTPLPTTPYPGGTPGGPPHTTRPYEPMTPISRVGDANPPSRPTHGTLQNGFGGYVGHRLPLFQMPGSWDAGHLLPAKGLENHVIPTPATRANMWGFFRSNINRLFTLTPTTQVNVTQGKAEDEGSPGTAGFGPTNYY